MLWRQLSPTSRTRHRHGPRRRAHAQSGRAHGERSRTLRDSTRQPAAQQWQGSLRPASAASSVCWGHPAGSHPHPAARSRRSRIPSSRTARSIGTVPVSAGEYANARCAKQPLRWHMPSTFNASTPCRAAARHVTCPICVPVTKAKLASVRQVKQSLSARRRRLPQRRRRPELVAKMPAF